MATFLNILALLCYVILMGSSILFGIYHFFVILPKLSQIGKSSLLRTIFIPGQDIADLMTYEDIAKSTKEKRQLRRYKQMGLVFIFSIPISVVVFMVKVIITKNFYLQF